jgi:hypothetical protein
MTYDDVLAARQQAEITIKRADSVTREAVSLAKGRLRVAGCWSGDLKALKRELQDFNANTGKWKERGEA